MNFEIDSQARELEILLGEFRETLRRLNNFHADDRWAKLRACAQIEQQIKTVRAAFVLELKAMEDLELQNKYRDWLRERNVTFKNLVAELEIKKNEIDREQLNMEADDMEDFNVDGGATVQQVTAQGDRVQDKTQDSVDRIKKLVADAEEVGLITAQKMDDQIAQMGEVGEALNDVEYNVKRAKQTAKLIARNAASDRCIQVLCSGIIIAVIIIIILAATKTS